MRKRSPYRPGRVAINAVAIAINGSRKLSRSDVDGQRRLNLRALTEFAQAVDCERHWRTLADAANMAESLADLGIGSGQQATEIIHDAQLALASVHKRRTAGGSWTLYPGELEALWVLLDLHELQMRECDYREFDTAFQRTETRVRQALAGNAARGAVIVRGVVA